MKRPGLAVLATLIAAVFVIDEVSFPANSQETDSETTASTELDRADALFPGDTRSRIFCRPTLTPRHCNRAATCCSHARPVRANFSAGTVR